MDIVVVFVFFFLALLASLYQGISLVVPLTLGLFAFTGVALRRGFTFAQLVAMMAAGSKKSLIVIKIFVLIGALTAVWRACGTVAFIVYYGIAFMNAQFFILSAFLLSSFVSFLLGTSFGTVGTMGVVLMILAKSGQVDVNMAAGAIIAGAYFGDRWSPMSSSANLVAVLTETQLYVNLKNMAKTAAIPFILSCMAYVLLSMANPLQFHNQEFAEELLKIFRLNWVVALPALVILAAAACKLDVKKAMTASILLGIVLGMVVQGQSLEEMLGFILLGYKLQGGGNVAQVMAGGGLYSMLQVSLIVGISSAYSGIFDGTGLLKEVEQLCERVEKWAGVYFSTVFTSMAAAAFGCNQTLAVMLTYQFQQGIYKKARRSSYRFAVDLENTVILLSVVIPWNIAGAVPAAMLSVDAGFIPYAFYLFLVPLVNGLLPLKIKEQV